MDCNSVLTVENLGANASNTRTKIKQLRDIYYVDVVSEVRIFEYAATLLHFSTWTRVF